MSALKNAIGDRGESEVTTALWQPISVAGYPNYLFSPRFLGEKAPVFDFVVYLLDPKGQATGAHFFLQVKATTTAATAKSCSARISKASVTRSVGFKCPAYVVAVDISKATSCELYISGIPSTLRKGITRIPVASRLTDPVVRTTLYDEVKSYFRGYRYSFASGL